MRHFFKHSASYKKAKKGLVAFVLALSAAFSSNLSQAQDLRGGPNRRGGEGSQGAPAETTHRPFTRPNLSGASTVVRTSDTREVPREEHLRICGQRCAFETAAEAMTAMGIYFQTHMRSTQEARSQESRENVANCTSNSPNGPACDQKRLLDSAMHYSFGRQIREAIITNNSSGENIRSLGYNSNSFIKDEPHEGSGAWSERRHHVSPQSPRESREYTDRELAERDTFQFDLKDFETPPLAEIAPEFYGEYQSFMQSFQLPDDRLFVRARDAEQEGTEGRAVASRGERLDGNSVVAFDEQNNPDVDRAVRDQVLEGMKVGYRQIRDQVAVATQVNTVNGKPQIDTPPSMLTRSNTGNVDEQIRRQRDAITMIRTRDPRQLPESLLQAIEGMNITRDEVARGTRRSDIIKNFEDRIRELEDLRRRNRSSEYVAAREINTNIRNVADSQRGSAANERYRRTVSLDMLDFENFLEDLWPTEAGQANQQRLREQSQSRDQRARVRIQ